MKLFDKALISAAMGMTLLTAAGAMAQVQMPGFFGNVDGFYGFRSGNGDSIDQGYQPNNSRPGDAWGASGRLGYMFASRWDVAVGGAYANFTAGKKFGTDDDIVNIQNAWFFNIDGEIGYNFIGPDYGVRVFGGARYQQWRHEMRFHPDAPLGCCFTNNTAHGFGPRAGVDGAMRLGMSDFSLIGGIDGAVLFGRTRSTGGPRILHGSDNRVMFNLDSRLGIDWEIAPLMHLAAGYRADWSNGVFFEKDNFNTALAGRGDRVVHGPFVRVAYNVGAPRAMPVPAPAPAPTAVMTKNFIVFFDFDRSDLSPQSRATIKQAADASKTGGVQRVGVTGHADKSGPDAYNMALSLRRANNVKDELVRDGVPAASIVVVGRGESQPLVPTADGVREPQNRRVEIVLQ